MRAYAQEVENRVRFIRRILAQAKADGIVYGNSGGKDSALVGILCKMACENTVGLIMPCGAKRGYDEDKKDAERVAQQFDIAVRMVDLLPVQKAFTGALQKCGTPAASALNNVPPRLRMAALYMIAASENRLVAGTGNRSEGYMGYFTKWGDGAYDFNPIADLTVREIYEFLHYLKAPQTIQTKAPSAGLFDGQLDENEMGVSYNSIDTFLLTGHADEHDRAIISGFHAKSEHKRRMPLVYEQR